MKAEEIVKKYSDMIYGVAVRYVRNKADAEDVYSEVFYRYFRRQRTFDNEEHRKAWLLRVTVNCSKELLINRDYHEEINDDMFGSTEITGTTGTKLEDIMALREALKGIKEEYREIIELYYFMELTVGEIAQMLQKSVNTVKSQLRRGREELKQMLS